MLQEPKNVVKRMKKASEVLTTDLAYMMQHCKGFALGLPLPQELMELPDPERALEVYIHDRVVELNMIIMDLRKELIKLGVTYEEAETDH